MLTIRHVIVSVACAFTAVQATAQSEQSDTGFTAPALNVHTWINQSASTPAPHFGDGHTTYLVGFTAYWCEGCPYTYGPLTQISRLYAPHGVKVIMVTDTEDKSMDFIRQYFTRHHVTLPVAITKYSDAYHLGSLPAVLMIDAQGVVRHRWTGGNLDSASYTEALMTALNHDLKLTSSDVAIHHVEQPQQSVAEDPNSALSVDALTKMTTFWSNYMKEPDSVRSAAEHASVNVPIGPAALPFKMRDVAALATKYPSVANDFQQAGLAPQQWQVYRVAFTSALVVRQMGGAAGVPAATSVLAKNMALLSAHQTDVDALKAAGMWAPHVRKGTGNAISISMEEP